MLIISLCPSKIKEEIPMKQLTSYNRVAGYLNKVFDLLNDEFFESQLSRPTITIQSTPKAYGHFSLREDTWVSKLGGTHEINIGAGTLARPIEEVAATLLHEMVHYHNYLHGVQDCSRGNTYHNRKFKDAAEERGLIVTHSDKYGWSHTSPSDRLLEFIMDNDLTDILLNRNTEEMEAGQYIIRWTSVLSQRFDSTAFKKVMPDVYKSFIKQTASRRFSIN